MPCKLAGRANRDAVAGATANDTAAGGGVVAAGITGGALIRGVSPEAAVRIFARAFAMRAAFSASISEVVMIIDYQIPTGISHYSDAPGGGRIMCPLWKLSNLIPTA